MLNMRLRTNNLYWIPLIEEDFESSYDKKLDQKKSSDETPVLLKYSVDYLDLSDIKNIYHKYVSDCAFSMTDYESEWIEVKKVFSYVEKNDKETSFNLLKEQDWYWEDDSGCVQDVRTSEEALNNAFNSLRKIINKSLI